MKRKLGFYRGMVKHHKTKPVGLWQGATAERPIKGLEVYKSRNSEDSKQVEVPKVETLRDEDVEPWLTNTGGMSLPRRQDMGEMEGGIRLLICHEEEPEVPGENYFYMTLDSFEAAEVHLNLPETTLPDLANIWGIQTSHIVESKAPSGEPSVALDITMKSANIDELPRAGLAMSHDFYSGITTAFLRGTHAVTKDAGFTVGHTLVTAVSNKLKGTRSLWDHPLLLPVILLDVELAKIRDYSRVKLRVDTQGIRDILNTHEYDDMAALLGSDNIDEESKKKRHHFTTDVNRLLCGAISVRRALQTARRSAAFLLRVLDEITTPEFRERVQKGHEPGDYSGKHFTNTDQQIRDLIRGLDNGATGFEVGIEAIISTLGVQLDILSTVAAQIDSSRGAEMAAQGAKMAAQAGIDSVAMKTLAVVTAVFLPATFIATMFSMSMFDWRAEAEDSEAGIVTNNFWVFWAIAVPLTLFVLGLWWLWLDVSKVFYAFKFNIDVRPRVTQTQAFGHWAKGMRGVVDRYDGSESASLGQSGHVKDGEP